MDDDKEPAVIAFRSPTETDGIVGQPKPGSKPRRGLNLCKCNRVFHHDDRRMFECQDCGVFWEAYDWVMHCLKWQLWKFSALEQTRAAIAEHSAILDDLLRREQNAKSRVRHWEGKAELRCGLQVK